MLERNVMGLVLHAGVVRLADLEVAFSSLSKLAMACSISGSREAMGSRPFSMVLVSWAR